MNKIELKRDLEKGKIWSYIREKWLIETPEEIVRQEFICKLVNDYDYPLELMGEELSIPSGHGDVRADIVIWKTEEDKRNNNNAFIVVECKAENIKINLKAFRQGASYAGHYRAQFLILCNSKEKQYYNFKLDKIPYLNPEDEILDFPKYTEINNTKRIDEIKSMTKAFSREEFTTLLSKCHNIIRNNDKLSPEAAFDEISKILFIKIYQERLKDRNVFTLEKYRENKKITEKSWEINNLKDMPSYMQTLFEQTKINFKGEHIFESNEILKIRENSFEAILKELEKYNLKETNDDIKGIAFEKFLGKTFRGELGQFFTPRTIVEFMTSILDPQEGEIICDPTCGSGGFLIKAFEYIQEKIDIDISKIESEFKFLTEGENYNNLSDEKKIEIEKKKKIFSEIISEERKKRLSNLAENCIFGTDANPRMARVSKMNMIMHGDGHCGVHHHDGLLNVNGIFEERFDVILTNPPFGARVDKESKITEADRFTDKILIEKYLKKYGARYQKVLDDIDKILKLPEKDRTILKLFDLGSKSTLTEVLFMERCLKLLKKGGRMGIVLPEGVLNTSNLQKVRDYFESRAKIILICSIPQDVFIAAGANIKPSLVFLKKFTEVEEKEYEIAKEEAQNTINVKYNNELTLLNTELKNKKENKEVMNETKSKIKDLEGKIEMEIKLKIKELFNYEIPIATVNKAGITTTGGICENELIEVEKEFREYNEKNKLWKIKDNKLKNDKLKEKIILFGDQNE